MAREPSVAELAARAAIAEVRHSYGYHIDPHDWEA
jgi:hypothetical protein